MTTQKPLITSGGTTQQLPNADTLLVGDGIEPSTGTALRIGAVGGTTTTTLPGPLQQTGIAAPAVSPAGSGRIYFDSTAGKFKVSQNGNSYLDLMGSGGTALLNPVGTNVTASRSLTAFAATVSGIYQNTTGVPLLVQVWVNRTGSTATAAAYVSSNLSIMQSSPSVGSSSDPTALPYYAQSIISNGFNSTVSFIVPAGYYYRVAADGTVNYPTTGTWWEYQLQIAGGGGLTNATANGIYQAPGTALNDAWTNLESGLGSPSWFAAAATQPKRTQFMEALGTTTASNRALFDKNTTSTPTGTYPGSSAFNGGVLLPDGRVFCVPNASTTARIYDPATDTLTTPTGTYPGSGAFIGGVLLPDGRVFCVPHNSTTARIYNPTTDTLTTPTGTYPGSAAFAGGVLLPDGRVFCVPLNSTTARIYDPTTDTLTTPTGTYPGSNAFVSGVLLPDGRVFCVPYFSTTARIYDPATDTLTTPSGTYPGTAALYGGVLLPDGRVFCVSHVSSARIYDPVTDTLTTPAGPAGTALGAFLGGVLLPDGRVFCVPSASTVKIYDPVTDTIVTPAGTYPGSNGLAGAVLLRDGRVFCVPYNSTTARIYTSRSVSMPDTLTMSPFLNSY